MDINCNAVNIDASDIDKVFPGKTQQIFEFIRDYKVPDGKPQAQFGFGGKLLDKVRAIFSPQIRAYHIWL